MVGIIDSNKACLVATVDSVTCTHMAYSKVEHHHYVMPHHYVLL